MASDLDICFDAALAAIIGPDGPLRIMPADGGDRIVPGDVFVTTAPATLPGFFDHFCAAHGGSEAIVAGEERITFAELGAWSDRIARALVGGWDIRKGDRVAIAMRNCPAWIATYIGIVKAGGIATLVNGWWQPAELGAGIALIEPALVVADGERARRIAEAGHGGRIVTLEIDAPLAQALGPLIDGVAEGERPTVVPEDDAVILFTSGSTGLSKGAVSTHRAVTTGTYTFLAFTASLLQVLVAEQRPPKHPPAALLAVPLFHVTGAVPVLLNSMAIGRKLVTMRKWDAGEALRLIARERVTYFVGVPTMSLELMQHPDHARHDLSSLSDIAAGGAARPVAHVQRLVDTFPDSNPMLGYGLTETNAAGCTNFRDNYVAKPASTGRAQAPFVHVAIFDDDGVVLPQGGTGEIGIRTRANFRGYWNNSNATAEAFYGAYFRTGDVGYLDTEGYLFIVDRAKDIIIRGGENISCLEVEAAIYTHPAVAEACVFGLPDERLGEVPVATVHLTDGSVLSADDLATFLAARLAKFKLPVQVWMAADPLPKLGTGKIDKKFLRARYRALADHSVTA